MNKYVSSDDFDKTVTALKAAIETAIIQATVASNFAFVALSMSKDLGQTITLLEKSLESGESAFLFSATTDDQIEKYRKYYLDQLNILRDLHMKSPHA